MLNIIVECLLIGFILALFGLDDMLIEVFQPLFPNITLTSSHYYTLWFLLACLIILFKVIGGRLL